MERISRTRGKGILPLFHLSRNAGLAVVSSILLLLAMSAAASTTEFSRAMFARAVKDESTSPLFVLILLQETNTKVRTICVPAPLLIGAIQMESNLSENDVGGNRAKQVAIANWNKPWVFAKAQARENVKPRYSGHVLHEVRRQLGSSANSALKAQLRSPGSALHEFYRTQHGHRFAAYRDAVAHVLLERGIAVGVADRSGGLFGP
jgi:hypothetical protein